VATVDGALDGAAILVGVGAVGEGAQRDEGAELGEEALHLLRLGVPELELADAFVGNAYDSDAVRVPASLREATALFATSVVAREAFGDDVVDHYLNNARVELSAYDAAVTDWERVRGFERL